MLTNELNPYYERIQMIESMEVQDELTLVVHSRVEGYVTLYAMTFPVVQGSTMDDAMPRGTGPYWYTEYVSGYGVRLEANPLWWKKDPEIHSVAAVNYAETGAALEALSTNQINLLSTQSTNAALYRKFSNLTSMDYPTTTFEMLVPNLSDDSPMGDVRMRQASPTRVSGTASSYVGDWKLTSEDEASYGEITMSLYNDGFGVIVTEGGLMAVRLGMQAGKFCLIDNEGLIMTVKNNNGVISFTILFSDGTQETLHMQRAK